MDARESRNNRKEKGFTVVPLSIKHSRGLVVATLDALSERGTSGSLMFCQSFGLDVLCSIMITLHEVAKPFSPFSVLFILVLIRLPKKLYFLPVK